MQEFAYQDHEQEKHAPRPTPTLGRIAWRRRRAAGCVGPLSNARTGPRVWLNGPWESACRHYCPVNFPVKTARAERWERAQVHRCNTPGAACARPNSQSLSQLSAGMCRWERALPKLRSETQRTKPTLASTPTRKLVKKLSKSDCCELLRMDSSTPMRTGSGSLRSRVKALGNWGWRARWAKDSDAIRSKKSSRRCWIKSQH